MHTALRSRMEVLTLHGPALQTRDARYGTAPRTIRVHGVSDATPCEVLWRAVVTAHAASRSSDLEIMGFPFFFLELEGDEPTPVWDVARPLGPARSVRVEYAHQFRHACADGPWGCVDVHPNASFHDIMRLSMAIPHKDGGYYVIDDDYALLHGDADVMNTVLAVNARLHASRYDGNGCPEAVDDLDYVPLDDPRMDLARWGVDEDICVRWVRDQIARDRAPPLSACPHLGSMLRVHCNVMTETLFWRGDIEQVRRLWTLVPPSEELVNWAAVSSHTRADARDPRWPHCSLAATFASWAAVPLTQAVKGRILLDSIGFQLQRAPREHADADAVAHAAALDVDELDGHAGLHAPDAWDDLRARIAARLGPDDETMIDRAFRLLVAPRTAAVLAAVPDLVLASPTDAAAALMLVHAYHEDDFTELCVAMVETLQRHHHDKLRKDFYNDLEFVILQKMVLRDGTFDLSESLSVDPRTGLPRDVARAWLRAHAHGAVDRIQRLPRTIQLRVAHLRPWLAVAPPRTVDELRWCQTLLRTRAVVQYDPEDLRPLQAIARGALAENLDEDPVGGVPFERGDWIGVHPCGHGARLDLLHEMDGDACFECGRPLLTLH